MTVCYFGFYNPEYSRNKILIRGLRANGVVVIECQSKKIGIASYFKLFKKHRAIKDAYDVMIVGFPGFHAMFLARLISRKPVVFDCFAPIYESMIEDRRQVSGLSPRRFMYWLLDYFSLHLADLVLLDTQAHIDYAAKKFHISPSRFARIWIGADAEVFTAVSGHTPSGDTKVLFFGTYIPLQGIRYIIEAAKLLKGEHIDFLLIGDGQEKKKMEALVRDAKLLRVQMAGNISQELLRKEAERADICLGIFGDTEKTLRVIPNKVFEALSMRLPVVTADTPAIRELFSDEHLALVYPHDPESLAHKILELSRDDAMRIRLAEEGHFALNENASPEVLGKGLYMVLFSFLERRERMSLHEKD